MKKYLPLIHKSFEEKRSVPITQYDFNFPYGNIIMLIILILFIVFIIYLVVNAKREKQKSQKKEIEEIMRIIKIRYLNGKISKEEYERLRRDLLEKEVNIKKKK